MLASHRFVDGRTILTRYHEEMLRGILIAYIAYIISAYVIEILISVYHKASLTLTQEKRDTTPRLCAEVIK